jgi:hypothetical protein
MQPFPAVHSAQTVQRANFLTCLLQFATSSRVPESLPFGEMQSAHRGQENTGFFRDTLRIGRVRG